MYKLIIQDDEGKTTVVPLIRDEITIGRKEGNTIRLTERNVSRKHARIVKANGTVVVEDLDSYNGVKVNGTRIQGRMSVNESDRIQIGDYLLELKVDRGAQDAAGTPPEGTQSVPPGAAMGANGGMSAPARALKPTLPMQPAGQIYDSSPPSQPPQTSVAVEQPGRLVVVSASFAGREFLLDKPTMVIGRTDDNDVVINHRSISRHHAKIVIEQGRYCIVDMQSSNGVRVNGEEYGKVELRRGDMVDLGHVRLRYVEPGEDFVFERDVQLVDMPPRPSKGRGALIGGLSVVVIAAAAVLFFVVRGSGTKIGAAAPEPPKVAVAESQLAPPAPAPSVAPPPQSQPAPEPAPASAPVVAPAPPPPAPTPKEDAAKLVDESKKHLAAEKWLDAYAAAEKALAADPGNEEARKLEEQAHAEFANEQSYQHFTEARDGGKVADAVKAAAQIPKNSVYKDKAEADLAAMRDKFLKERELQARAFAAKGQCEKIAALARQSGEVFAEARAAVEKAGARCTAAAPVEREPAAAAPVAASPAAMTDDDAQKLIEDARQAALTSNWPEARRKAEQVLKVRPDDQDALSIAGVSSCNLKDKDRAQRYMKRLKGMRQLSMQQICAQQSLFFDE